MAEISSNAPKMEALTVFQHDNSARAEVLFFSLSTQAICVKGCIAPMTRRNLMSIQLTGFPPSLTSSSFIFTLSNSSTGVKNLIFSGGKYLVTIEIPSVLSQSLPLQMYFLRAALKGDETVAGIANFTLVRSPKLTGARFNGFGSQLTLDFDQDTNAPLRRVDCSQVIAAGNLSSLGNGYHCYWLTASQLRVLLGREASLMPTNTLSFIGNISDFQGISSTDGVEQSVVVGAPSLLPAPEVTLTGPNQISYCENAELVANVDSPRPASFTWSVVNDLALNDVVADVSGPVLRLTPSMLQTGMTYNITASVLTFLGASATSSTHSLFVSANPIPTLNIDVPPSPYVRPTPIFFASQATFAPCDTNKGQIQMTWQVSLAGFSILSGDGPFFEAKTTELVAGNQYTCTLSGFTVQGDILTTQVPFIVGYAGTKAKIEGGNRTISITDDVVLNASSSEDLDTCEGVVKNQSCSSYPLIFQWSCYLCGSPCRTVNGSLVLLPSLPAFVYNFQHLDFSVCNVIQVRVQVSSGLQTDITSVFLNITTGLSPGAQIQVVSEDTFMISLKGSCKTSCSEYQWSIYDSNGNLLAGNQWEAENPSLPAGLNTESLVVYRSFFSPGTYRIELSAITGSISGRATKSLYISFPPTGGQCTVLPTTGAALIDTFTCSCQYWISSARPLFYVFAIHPSSQSSQVSSSAPSSLTSYSFSLPAGGYVVYAEIIDSDGNMAVSGRTNIQVVQAPVVVNSSSLSGSEFADVSKVLDDMNSLGSVSQILQLSSSFASSLETGEAAKRRLLASSLAYRMRVRTMLLRSMAKGPVKTSMNQRTATSALSTSLKLNNQPSEIDLAAFSDSSQVIESCASHLRASDLRQGMFVTLFATENNRIEVSKRYNKTMRDVTMLSVLNVLLKTCEVYLSSMVSSEKPMSLSSVNMKVHTFRLRSDLKQYNFTTWTYSFDLRFAFRNDTLVTQSGDLGLYVAEMYAFWRLDYLHALQYHEVSEKPILFLPVYPGKSLASMFECPSQNKFCLRVKLSFPRVHMNRTENYLVDLKQQLACVLWLTNVSTWSLDACQLTSVIENNENSLAVFCSCSSSGALLVVRNLRYSAIYPSLGLMPIEQRTAKWAMFTIISVTLLFGLLIFLVMFNNSSLNNFLRDDKLMKRNIQHQHQCLIGEVVFAAVGHVETKEGLDPGFSHRERHGTLCDDSLDEIGLGRNSFHSMWPEEETICKTLKKKDRRKVILRKKCTVPDTSYKLA